MQVENINREKEVIRLKEIQYQEQVRLNHLIQEEKLKEILMEERMKAKAKEERIDQLVQDKRRE